eukprot:COSAG02_NODE_21744_length_776_cov_3.556571_1_plen_72_part_10
MGDHIGLPSTLYRASLSHTWVGDRVREIPTSFAPLEHERRVPSDERAVGAQAACAQRIAAGVVPRPHRGVCQ